MTDEARRRMLEQLEDIPCWKDANGKLVTPDSVLKTASALLVVLGNALTDDEDKRARVAVLDTAKFLLVISQAANEHQFSKVASA